MSTYFFFKSTCRDMACVDDSPTYRDNSKQPYIAAQIAIWCPCRCSLDDVIAQNI